jgi:hypothetical protein
MTLKDELQKSDIYEDIGDFKNLNQLELNKKTQKWKKIYEFINNDVNYIHRKHLMKYAKKLNPDIMFWEDKIADSNGKLRPTQMTRHDFWISYIKFFKNLLTDSIKYYLDHRDINKQASKDKLEIHKNKEVKCLCGGSYTLKNKAQHFKTKSHQDHLEELEKD